MKYLKTYESFKVIAEEEFDELERFIEQVATLIPGASKVNVHKMIYKDSDLSSINFNFSGRGFYKDKKYWFQIRPYANEMAVTVRKGTLYTYVELYTDENYAQVCKDLLCRFIGTRNKKLIEFLDAYTSGKDFGLL